MGAGFFDTFVELDQLLLSLLAGCAAFCVCADRAADGSGFMDAVLLALINSGDGFRIGLCVRIPIV